jgi:hypothetical protein
MAEAAPGMASAAVAVAVAETAEAASVVTAVTAGAAADAALLTAFAAESSAGFLPQAVRAATATREAKRSDVFILFL